MVLRTTGTLECRPRVPEEGGSKLASERAVLGCVGDDERAGGARLVGEILASDASGAGGAGGEVVLNMDAEE